MATPYHVVSATEEVEEFEETPLSLREFAVGVLCLTTVFLLVSVNNQYLPKPDPLVIHLDRFSVSNFSVAAASKLHAVWDADVTLMNPNGGSDIQIAYFQSLLYKEGEVVSCATVDDPISIRPMEQHSMRIGFNATGCGEQHSVNEKVAEEMRAEREKGTVRLELGMNMVIQATFSPDRLRPLQPGMSISANCSSLSVGFVSGTGQGKLVDNVAGVRCLIPRQSSE